MLPLSPYLKSQFALQNRDGQLVALITLSHPTIATLRFVSDVKPITVLGEAFEAFPFGFQFPGEGDAIQEARIVIQNVTKEIGQAIRQVKGEIDVTLACVAREEPDAIIADYPGLKLRNASVTNATISGTITGRINANSAWPGLTASPRLTPGLHFT